MDTTEIGTTNSNSLTIIRLGTADVESNTQQCQLLFIRIRALFLVA